MPSEFEDPYIDPETGVLRNLVGAQTYDELARAEGEFAALRMGELFERGDLHPTGTLDDFRRIHRALLQDVYEWAGCIRTIEIRKNVEGAEFFLMMRVTTSIGAACPVKRITRRAVLRLRAGITQR